MNDPDPIDIDENEPTDKYLRYLMGLSIVSAGLGFIGWFGWEIFFGTLRPVVFGMSHLHYATVIGVPCSGFRGAIYRALTAHGCGRHSIQSIRIRIQGCVCSQLSDGVRVTGHTDIRKTYPIQP